MNIAGVTGAITLAVLSTPAFAERCRSISGRSIGRANITIKWPRSFRPRNPDIKVNVRSVQFPDMVNELAKAMATGEAPDVTYIDNPDVALFAARKLLLDMKPMIDQSSAIKLDQIYPGPLASVSYKGGVYGIPRGANTIALYYNADLFKSAGLDPAKPPKTGMSFTAAPRR